MRAMLIDDEQPVLDSLQKKINQLSDIEIIGAFTNPHQGLIEVSKEQPEVLFLDVSMPEVSGLDLAKQLKYSIPEMKIVFLAQFDDEDLDALEIQAMDYILKPVEETRLQKTLINIWMGRDLQGLIYQPMISCFGKLSFYCYENNKEISNLSWRTSKAQDVFAYLVHEREKTVRKDVIVDLFWPDSSLRTAYNQLYSTIYQIRKSLASAGLDVQIVSIENNYKLELRNHLVDVDIWKKGIKNMPLVTASNVEVHKKLIHLYKGDYLEEENYMWAMNEKNHLRIVWINLVRRVLDYYLSINNYEEAILLYLNFQKITPYNAESYFGLMKLYAQINERYAVREQYRLLKEMLEEEFELDPSEEIVAWYENWKKHGY